MVESKSSAEATHEPPALVTISKHQVPLHLRTGAFYQSLEGDEEDDMISVPANTLKHDRSLSGVADLDHLLNSLRFWGVDGICKEAVNFVLRKKHDAKPFHDVLTKYEMNFSYLKPLRMHIAQPKICALYFAVDCGEIELVQHLHNDRKKAKHSDLALHAVKHGQLDCLRYLSDMGYACSSHDTVRAAAKKGHIGCFRFVYDKYLGEYYNHPIEWTLPINDTNIDCFIYTYSKADSLRYRKKAAEAVLYNSVKSVRYCHQNGVVIESFMFLRAMLLNDLGAFECLHELGCPWSEAVADKAVVSNKLCFLRYAREQGCPWIGGELCRKAAHLGNIDTLKYLYEQGCVCNALTCERAAAAGHIDCLRFLHEAGCAWNSTVSKSAVTSGNFECLKYVQQAGCPCNRAVLMEAIKCNRIRFVQYLVQHGCGWNKEVLDEAEKLNNACSRYIAWVSKRVV